MEPIEDCELPVPDDHVEKTSQLAGYRYRVLPTIAQKVALEHVFDCARLAFNDHLHANGFNLFGPRLPYRDYRATQALLVTKAKKSPDRRLFTAVPDTALRQSIRDADVACRRFLDSVGSEGSHHVIEQPRYKDPKDARKTFRLGKGDFSLRRISKHVSLLHLPKELGSLQLTRTRDLPSDPSSATIIKEPDSTYFASFPVVRQITPLPTLTRWAGVDLGLTTLASIVYSDGTREKIPAPHHLKQAENAIATAGRKMRRAQKGSKNREKLRRHLAALHKRVRDRRADDLHKLALRLVTENEVIVFETLAIANMARDRFSKSIYDAGWGILVKLVRHKAERYGRTVTQIDRYVATTQTCAPCEANDGPKALSIREWRCPQCGVLLDRDFNAAVNVLVAAGCAETLNAGGRPLRILLARADSEAGTPGEANDPL